MPLDDQPPETDPTLIVCDVAGLADPDLADIELLARMRLVARQAGWGFRVRGASTELRELLELCGLCEALSVEMEGQPEQRKEARRLEEERDAADPAV